MTAAQASFTPREPRELLFDRARAYVERGTALGGDLNVADAQVALRVAVQLARCCGADTVADQALAELRRAGGRTL